MDYRSNWWKSYRRQNKSGVFFGLLKEHYSEFNSILPAFFSTLDLLKVAKHHDDDQWEKVDQKLESHYRRFA